MVHDRLETSVRGKGNPAKPQVVEWIAPHLLTPHPRHMAIYGEEDVADLVEALHISGWMKPLVITQQNVIISGHRCWKAASILKWDAVPVERRVFATASEEIEALLLENRHRTKTPEQRVREAEAWEAGRTGQSCPATTGVSRNQIYREPSAHLR